MTQRYIRYDPRLPADLSIAGALGTYRLETYLRAGRAGEVWTARRDDGTRWAVKVYQPRFESDRHDAFLAAHFLHAAEVQAQIDHPRVPKLIERLATPHGETVIMEYIEGPTLNEVRFNRLHPLYEVEALPIAIQFCRIVHDLHQLGRSRHTCDPIRTVRDGHTNNAIWSGGNTLYLIDLGDSHTDDRLFYREQIKAAALFLLLTSDSIMQFPGAALERAALSRGCKAVIANALSAGYADMAAFADALALVQAGEHDVERLLVGSSPA